MTIVSMPSFDEHAPEGEATAEPVRPFTILGSVPSPLSDDVEEIVAYMRLIGDRRGSPRAD